jgi:hypothetical protein
MEMSQGNSRYSNFKEAKMSFFKTKTENKKGKQVLSGEVSTSERERI